MKHVIVESLEAYEWAAKRLGNAPMLWRTTSPGLLEIFSRAGIPAESLEAHQSKGDPVGRAAYDFAATASQYLDDKCPWRDYFRFDKTLGMTMANLFHVVVYKGWLMAEAFFQSGGELVCVGDPALKPARMQNPMFDRFDTLYAHIASRLLEWGGLMVHTPDRGRLARLDRWVSNRPMTGWEKCLSIMNNTPGSAAFKAWRYLLRRGRLKRFRLLPSIRRRVFFYKSCELIEEAFLRFLLRGAQCEWILSISAAEDNAATDMFPDRDQTSATMAKIAAEAASAHGINFGGSQNELAKVCYEIVAERICDTLNDIYGNRGTLTEEFAALANKIGDGILVTNFFTSVPERLFGQYCREQGVEVVTCEHGITLGLSAWASYPTRYWGMLTGSVGAYHWRLSVESLRPWFNGHRPMIAGIPKVMRRVLLPSLQRLLVRRMLKHSNDKQVVVYVADLERNNLVYGPHIDNDFQYMKVTKSIVEDLVSRFPGAIILLKLYPTHRYPESFQFFSLRTKYDNLQLLKGIDFRFLRAGADIIALSSGQSTLGWALGAGVPVLMYEKAAMPIHLKGKELPHDVYGVNRLIEIDNFFDSDCSGDISEII